LGGYDLIWCERGCGSTCPADRHAPFAAHLCPRGDDACGGSVQQSRVLLRRPGGLSNLTGSSGGGEQPLTYRAKDRLKPFVGVTESDRLNRLSDCHKQISGSKGLANTFRALVMPEMNRGTEFPGLANLLSVLYHRAIQGTPLRDSVLLA
jgi:hypothetical protein